MSNSGALDTVMQETRVFAPTKEFAEKARIPSYEAYEKLWNEAAADTEAFWAKQARSYTGLNLSPRLLSGTNLSPSGSSGARRTRATTASMRT